MAMAAFGEILMAPPILNMLPGARRDYPPVARIMAPPYYRPYYGLTDDHRPIESRVLTAQHGWHDVSAQPQAVGPLTTSRSL